jgi:hypothetical protein
MKLKLIPVLFVFIASNALAGKGQIIEGANGDEYYISTETISKQKDGLIKFTYIWNLAVPKVINGKDVNSVQNKLIADCTRNRTGLIESNGYSGKDLKGKLISPYKYVSPDWRQNEDGTIGNRIVKQICDGDVNLATEQTKDAPTKSLENNSSTSKKTNGLISESEREEFAAKLQNFATNTFKSLNLKKDDVARINDLAVGDKYIISESTNTVSNGKTICTLEIKDPLAISAGGKCPISMFGRDITADATFAKLDTKGSDWVVTQINATIEKPDYDVIIPAIISRWGNPIGSNAIDNSKNPGKLCDKAIPGGSVNDQIRKWDCEIDMNNHPVMKFALSPDQKLLSFKRGQANLKLLKSEHKMMNYVNFKEASILITRTDVGDAIEKIKNQAKIYQNELVRKKNSSKIKDF